jgi:hypothetical protein
MATPTNLPASFTAGAILTADQQNSLRGAFRILQVVYGTTTTQTSSTTTTYATTTLSANITPQSNTSKILVFQNVHLFAGGANTQIGLRITRLIAASPTTLLTNDGAMSSGGGTIQGIVSQFYLDSPATTSACTYRADFNRASGSDTVYSQLSSNPSTMILMEVSA